MGFTNDFTFGSFRLSSLVDWRKGGLGVNLTNDYFYGSGLAKDTALAAAQLTAFSQGTDVWLENTGFVKIRVDGVASLPGPCPECAYRAQRT